MPDSQVASPGGGTTEARFLAALQNMMGDVELTDESVREAIAKLTPQQKQQLMEEAGGQELKREMLTSEESKNDRDLYFKEVNRSAEQNGLPVDKDNTHLAKKLSAFMQGSSDEVPQLLLEEALASTPYLVKAALAEAQKAGAEGAVPSDLAEIEAALSVLKVPGWCQGEAAGRPPVVRRNLLLLHSHMHRDRLKALAVADSTRLAAEEVVSKSRRLLDVLFAYSQQLQWVKATLAITSLQALLTNGLWDHSDDECRGLMKGRLATVGLKVPKLSLRCTAADVFPGETLSIQVSVTRSHAYSPAELEAYRATSSAAEAAAEAPATAGDEEVVRVDDAQEGWWLFVESLRALPNLGKQGLLSDEVHHNVLVARQTLSPKLEDAVMSATVQFTAPASPGEYKVVVHVRSSSMVGFDVKRKVSFTVRNGKRAQPSTSSGTSTDDSKSMENEREATINEVDEEAETGEAAVTEAGAAAQAVAVS